MEEEAPPKKKKGCLFGCLAIIVIIIVLVAGLAVFGYLNREKLLPFIAEKTGAGVVTVIKYAGQKAETGMPSEFMDRAYKIDIPEGNRTIRVTTSDKPADRSYEIFIQHYRDQGWEVKTEAEAESLKPASEHMEAVSGYIEEDIRFAELEKDGQKMNLAVGRFNEETVGAVWQSQDNQ